MVAGLPVGYILATTMFSNLKYGFRRIVRQPLVSLAIVLTLGLGIGAMTAIFSFANALLLRPFPFRDPEQLVEIHSIRGGEQGKLSMREVVETKIHGVKPEDAQTLKALGFDNVSLRDLTRVRMFGVTESYVKELRGLGFDKLTLEDVIRLKQFGVDAEYIRKLRAAGFKNISSNDLLKLKARGLDAILLKN